MYCSAMIIIIERRITSFNKIKIKNIFMVFNIRLGQFKAFIGKTLSDNKIKNDVQQYYMMQ